MALGGAAAEDDNAENAGYDFTEGIGGGFYGSGYLKSIQNISPESGDFWILPGKTVDVFEHDIELNTIVVSLPIHHKQPDKTYTELDLMLWRMYHCVNSLTGRLQIFDPSIPKDGNHSISNMGPYLGTYLQYQALVARWNTYAWDSSFMLEVTPAGERATIVMGYTNLNCYEKGPIEMAFTATLISTTNSSDPDVDYSTSPITIYNQGSDSRLDDGTVKITTTYKRNGNETSGSGYEDRYPGTFVDAAATVTLEPAIAGGDVMRAEQYYRTIAAIAPCSGVDKEYHIQTGTPTVFHEIEIVATWIIGTVTVSKEATVDIAAVGVRRQEASQ